MSESLDTSCHPVFLFCRFAVRVIFRLMLSWRIEGREHVPPSGPVILASNHISNFDPPLVGACLKRQLHFMAKSELFRYQPFAKLLRVVGAFPVRRGQNDKSALKSAILRAQSGHCVIVFPEGHRSKTGELGEGMPGVAFIARKAQCPIVPVAVIGPYGFRRRVTVRFGPAFLPDSADTNDTLLHKIMLQIKQLQ